MKAASVTMTVSRSRATRFPSISQWRNGASRVWLTGTSGEAEARPRKPVGVRHPWREIGGVGRPSSPCVVEILRDRVPGRRRERDLRWIFPEKCGEEPRHRVREDPVDDADQEVIVQVAAISFRGGCRLPASGRESADARFGALRSGRPSWPDRRADWGEARGS